MENLQGKCVLLCVSGGIAAYKMPNVASALRKAGAEVHVVMTQNATQFITPLTFESLTNHRCVVDTFARDFQYDIAHVSLATAADLILVAPATADVIAKLAHGIADDMLTTVVLAARCKKLVAPAMNTAMLENPITQDNLADLARSYGFSIIDPDSGLLGLPSGGQWEDAGTGGFAGPHCPGTGPGEDPGRGSGDGDGRPHPGGPGPGALPYQPQLRPDGVCHCPGGHAPGGAGDPGLRTGGPALGSLCGDPSGDHGGGHVPGGAGDLLPATDVLIKAAAVADYRPAQVASDKMKKSGPGLVHPPGAHR